MKYTSEIRESDVLLGRGSKPGDHCGNISFRLTIKQFSPQYKDASARSEKAKIAKQVLAIIQSNKGRFLRKVDEREMLAISTVNDEVDVEGDINSDDIYQVIESTPVIMEKIKQAFRHRVRSFHGTTVTKRRQQHQPNAKAKATAKKSIAMSQSAPRDDDLSSVATPPPKSSATTTNIISPPTLSNSGAVLGPPARNQQPDAVASTTCSPHLNAQTLASQFPACASPHGLTNLLEASYERRSTNLQPPSLVQLLCSSAVSPKKINRPRIATPGSVNMPTIMPVTPMTNVHHATPNDSVRDATIRNLHLSLALPLRKPSVMSQYQQIVDAQALLLSGLPTQAQQQPAPSTVLFTPPVTSVPMPDLGLTDTSLFNRRMLELKLIAVERIIRQRALP